MFLLPQKFPVLPRQHSHQKQPQTLSKYSSKFFSLHSSCLMIFRCI